MHGRRWQVYGSAATTTTTTTAQRIRGRGKGGRGHASVQVCERAGRFSWSPYARRRGVREIRSSERRRIGRLRTHRRTRAQRQTGRTDGRTGPGRTKRAGGRAAQEEDDLRQTQTRARDRGRPGQRRTETSGSEPLLPRLPRRTRERDRRSTTLVGCPLFLFDGRTLPVSGTCGATGGAAAAGGGGARRSGQRREPGGRSRRPVKKTRAEQLPAVILEDQVLQLHRKSPAPVKVSPRNDHANCK